MPGRVIGENRSDAIAPIVTALSCAALLWSTLDRPPGRQPLPGTRTAIELIASASQRALLRDVVTPFQRR